MYGLSSRLAVIDKNIELTSNYIATLNNQLDELCNMRKELVDWDKLVYTVKQNCHDIEKINTNQTYQQTFLEELDGRFRENNFFIKGLPESDIQSPIGKTDEEKLQSIFQKMEVSLGEVTFSMRRYGPYAVQPRPLQVTLSCPKKCIEILNNVYKLKDDDNYSSIYIEKELHRTVHHELGRLRIRKRIEKNKPENITSRIHYDRKKRIVTKNGQVIDKFSPSFV